MWWKGEWEATGDQLVQRGMLVSIFRISMLNAKSKSVHLLPCCIIDQI